MSTTEINMSPEEIIEIITRLNTIIKKQANKIEVLEARLRLFSPTKHNLKNTKLNKKSR